MKTIKPKVTVISHSEQKEKELKFIEFADWVSRKEDRKITEESYRKSLLALMGNDGQVALEHISTSVHFVCDRETSTKLTKHRLISFSQESDLIKYDNIIFISPLFCHKETKFYNDKLCKVWTDSVAKIEEGYLKSLNDGLPVADANGMLPGCTKTELLITTNLRQWKHIIDSECTRQTHANVLLVMIPLLKELNKDYPVIFSDVYDKYIKVATSNKEDIK